MNNFYVQVKSSETDEIVEEFGPMSERKAVKVANGMDINMASNYYTEVVEKGKLKRSIRPLETVGWWKNGGLFTEQPAGVSYPVCRMLDADRTQSVAADLLGALIEVVDAADGDGWASLDPSLKRQRAAIAKAVGGK